MLNKLIGIMYDAWKSLATITGVMTVLLSLISYLANDKNGKNGNKNATKSKYFSKVFLGITIFFFATEIVIGVFFTKVPCVLYFEYGHAIDVLREANLDIELPSEYEHELIVNSYVISQNVDSETIVPKHTKIKLELSMFKSETIEKNVIIPDTKINNYEKITFDEKKQDNDIEEKNILDSDLTKYIGMEANKAIGMLLESGFKRVSSQGALVEVGHGYVSNISLIDEESVLIDTIGVELDKMVEVPNVVGLEQLEAVRVLYESGLTFQVHWNEGDCNGDVYYVYSQEIKPQSVVLAGTKVDLWIHD